MESKFKNCIKLSGLGMTPRPSYAHIDIVHKIERGLWLQLNKEEYIVWQEVQILKEGRKEIVPDVVVLINKQTGGNEDVLFPIIIIEINQGKYVQKAIEKAMSIMKANTTIGEAFVFDYINKTWHKITKADYAISSHSDILDKDLRVLML